MAITVKLKHLSIAPRKVRLVAKMIRKKTVEQAENQLRFGVKEAALPIQKLLHSAVATAENDFGKEKSELFIKEIKVDEGVTLKRARPRARGRVYRILKRSSHITLVLDEINPDKQEPKAAKATKTTKAAKATEAIETAKAAEGAGTEGAEKEKTKKPKLPQTAEPRKRVERNAEKIKPKASLKRVFRRKSF